jgi:hypothetical protein
MAYPTSVATDSDLYLAKNQLATQLDGSIDASQTTITVDSTTGFPTVGFVTIDSEVIKYTGTTATQFTGCTRGADGTGATTHMDNAPVRHTVVAAHHNALKDELIAVETDIINTLKAQLGLKNRMVNGDFLFDQVNEGNNYTITGGSFQHCMDMTSALAQGTGVFTVARGFTSPPTFFIRYLTAACTTADASIGSTDVYALRMRTEGYSVRDFSLGNSTAKTFTISFWVRSSLTGTYCVTVHNNATNRSYVTEYTINVANTWEYKTVTLTGDLTGTWENSTNTGLSLVWALAVGTNNQTAPNVWTAGGFYATSNQVNWMSSNTSRTFDLTGVQVELGSTATAFGLRAYQTELALCQRYYEKSYNLGVTVPTSTNDGAINDGTSSTGAGAVNRSILFKANKRVNPTLTAYTLSGTSGSWGYDRNGASGTVTVAFNPGQHGAYGSTSSVGANWVVVNIQGHWIADARL